MGVENTRDLSARPEQLINAGCRGGLGLFSTWCWPRSVHGRFGKPVAEIVPPSCAPGQNSWNGSMKDTMDIVADNVSPVIDEKDIEALRD